MAECLNVTASPLFLFHYYEGQLGGSGDMQLPKLIVDLGVVSSLVNTVVWSF